MNFFGLDDAQVEALVRGETPTGRSDLVSLADAVAVLRDEVVYAPAPSPELAALLGLDHAVVGAAPTMAATVAAMEGTAPGREAEPARRRSRMFVEWIAGLGMAAKAALGTSVAVASIGAAGFAGVLPDPAQSAIDGIVSSNEAPDESETDTQESEVGAELVEDEKPETERGKSAEHASEEGLEGQERGERLGTEGRERGARLAEEAGERADTKRAEAQERGAEAEDAGRANAPDGRGEPTEEEQGAREDAAEKQDGARDGDASDGGSGQTDSAPEVDQQEGTEDGAPEELPARR